MMTVIFSLKWDHFLAFGGETLVTFPRSELKLYFKCLTQKHVNQVTETGLDLENSFAFGMKMKLKGM